jgi:hypothetical protein
MALTISPTPTGSKANPLAINCRRKRGNGGKSDNQFDNCKRVGMCLDLIDPSVIATTEVRREK